MWVTVKLYVNDSTYKTDAGKTIASFLRAVMRALEHDGLVRDVTVCENDSEPYIA